MRACACARWSPNGERESGHWWCRSTNAGKNRISAGFDQSNARSHYVKRIGGKKTVLHIWGAGLQVVSGNHNESKGDLNYTCVHRTSDLQTI